MSYLLKRSMGPLWLGQCNGQSVGTLSQREQLIVETHGPGYQDEVVSYSPCDPLSLVSRRGSLMSIILLVNIWWANGNTCLDTNAAVETGKPHPVTEGMGEDTRVDIAGADEDKSSEEAKQRGVCKLEEGPSHGQDKRDARVGDAELVQVVDMGDAKVKWGQEDDLFAGEAG